MVPCHSPFTFSQAREGALREPLREADLRFPKVRSTKAGGEAVPRAAQGGQARGGKSCTGNFLFFQQ